MSTQPQHRKALLAGLITLVAIAGIVSTGRLNSQPSQTRPVVIRGYLAVAVGGEGVTLAAVGRGKLHDVYLPNIKVFLQDASSGNPVGGAVPTDLSGRFSLSAPTPARYRICWNARGFGQNCAADIVSVSNQNVFLSTVRIQPERPANTTIVFGRVRMKDGTAVRRLEPLANINAFGRVTLADSAGREIASVIVNNFGEYLIPGVPGNDAIVLRSSIEGGKGEQPILPDARIGTVPFNPIDLVVGNTPPRVAPLFATNAAGRIVKNANPGSTVTLKAQASDADGDPIEFLWMLGTDSGTLSATSGPQVQWALPSRPGRFTVTVFAHDRKGGYSDSSLALLADGRGIPFAGHVAGTDAASLNGAQVEVNGQLAVTGAQGLFQLRVRDADRFVLNIRKPGYALVSQIYDAGVTSGRWTMTRASMHTMDPARDQVLVNRRDPASCPGKIADRLAKLTATGAQPGALVPALNLLPQYTAVQWQDGKSNVIAPGKLDLPTRRRAIEGCGPGIQVKIASNSLVDPQGRAPAGNVTVALSTIDLQSPDQMPGDYTVRIPGAAPKVMQSYGAGSIEVTGPGGTRFNLKPGATAEVTIPVDRSQLAVGAPLPPTIPILFYNERTGVWAQDGVATLTGGNRYVAMVTHFSNINCDTLKTDQACVRVLSPTLAPSYDMEVTVPQSGGAAPKDITRTVGNSPYALYNLPLHTNIVLTAIRTDVNPHVPYGNFIVNTGDKQNPTVPNEPAAPYTACSTEVTLTQLTIPPEPLSGEYLQGLSSFEASNLNELAVSDPTLAMNLDLSTVSYYQNIDPRGKRTNFTDFKNVNDLNGGANEIHSIYANSGDLGFGRDMHCKRTGLDVACYVTNYGSILTDDLQDAIDAVGGAGHSPVATVAMEYSRIESPLGTGNEFDDPERVVKFYVFSGDGTHLLNSADLDTGVNSRKRPVPQLCMVCHGGAYPFLWGADTAPTLDSREHVKLGSTFLPFDLHFYTFAPAPNDKATQQPFFKQLNEDIVKNTPPGTALAEVITKMYAGGPTQDENFAVAGWDAQPVPRGMYKDVVARACRTCHIANSFAPLKFDLSTQMTDSLLGGVEARVCSQYVMPHAKVTHNLFWGSFGPSMPAQLQIFGDTFKTGLNGWQGNLCGPFTIGGATPQSFFTTTIQPIFNVNCTGCHNGGNPAAGLNLAAGSSIVNLVNVTSSEVPTKKRVLPNDAANSYLFQKISGSAGIVGVQMPKNNPPLSAADIGSIQTWINTGANP